MKNKLEWLKRNCIAGWLIALLHLVAGDLFGENRLGPPVWETNGWLRIQGRVLTNQLVLLEASSNLTDWSALAVLDYRILNAANWQIEATNEGFSFLDAATPSGRGRYYRFATTAFSETNDWKNQAMFPTDIFAQSQSGSGEDRLSWIKFAIPLREPFRVFYQNSQQYLLHHDFAAQRLEPFVGLSRAAFDQVSLYTNHQEVLLGAVLFPPRADQAEYGIQFAGRDPLPRETVQRFFELVRSTVVAPPECTAFYFPAYEQAEAAAMNETYLADRGIKISSVNRWIVGTQVYSSGWALGRIKYIPAGEIAAAYADGRLQPGDILLTDGVPAEVPFVAGIISLVPATPNSHVAILANAYGVPFLYLAGAAEQNRVRQLIGKEVICQAGLKAGVAQVMIVDVDGKLDAEFRTALLAAKQPLKPNIQSKVAFGAFSAATDLLTLKDIQYFGGKAANFGLLRRTVPTNCPAAIAFSFDLWDAFMAQTLTNGHTLGAEISNRLSGYTYPPNVAAVKTNLAAIRDLITKKASFNDAQKHVITNALAVFDPNRNIRFRSSSNAEDGQTYSAAGLYDSYSGCLADDLDGDTSGPCHCDEAEPGERGVFRAIQKVYASFYNDNAFLERLRHGLDESQVGMALLVHHSTPDAEEMANGVATVTLEAAGWFGPPPMKAQLVTQLGAVSVTNPEGNGKPEVSECGQLGGPMLVQSSSLVPLGSWVMAEDDYATLRDLLFKVYTNYPGVILTNATKALTLDFEYKKVQPGQLLLKQVRELPAALTNQTQRFLLGESTTYWVYQREGSQVFANHHLKCNLTLASKNLTLNDAGLAHCFYTNASFEYRDGTRIETLTGSPATWSNATHTVSLDPQRGMVVTDTWTVGAGASLRAFELTSIIPNSASSATPFLPQAELRKWLRVTYATAVPTVDWQGNGTNTLEEEVQLVMRPDLATLQPDQGRTLKTTNGLTFELSFQNSTNAADPPLGVDPNVWGNYPAAISPWIHARITGLTTEPLVLTGYYSQSAAAGHKYRHSEFIFEPRLEPKLPASQLQELTTRNIQSIWVSCDGFLDGAPAQLEVMVSLLGIDGVFRKP